MSQRTVHKRYEKYLMYEKCHEIIKGSITSKQTDKNCIHSENQPTSHVTVIAK